MTTDPPRASQHLEWEVAFALGGSEPMRVAALAEHGSETHWVLVGGEPALECELRARFAPSRFRTSDAVYVDFEGRRIRVDDRALKQDARTVAQVTAPERAETGTVTDLLDLPGHAIRLAFIAFAHDDTEVRRLDRWRVDPAVAAALPASLAPLASGYQTGTLTGGPVF